MPLLTNENILNVFKEGPSLINFFPYADEQDGLFYLVDGSVGQIWELSALPGECWSMDRLLGVSNAMAALISRLPACMAAQMICSSDGDVGQTVEKYRLGNSTVCDDLGKAVSDGKCKHMLSSNKSRRIQILVALRMFDNKKGSSQENSKNVYRTERQEDRPLEGIAASLTRSTGGFSEGLAAAGCTSKQWTHRDLGTFLYQWLNPKRARLLPFTGGSRHEFIRDQVLFNAPLVNGSGFVFDGAHTRVITLKELPSVTWPAMFSKVMHEGEGVMDVCREFIFAVNFYVPDQAKVMEGLKIQKKFALIQKTSSMGDISEEAVHKKEELSEVISDAFKGGSPIIYARMHFIPFAESTEEVERASDGFLSALSRCGAEGNKEEIIAPTLLLSCLPLNFDHNGEAFVRRRRRLRANNATDMMPCYGSFMGTRTPAAMYMNQRGEPVFLDFFDSSTNPHAAIIGASGSGKSFFCNDMIYQNWRLGGQFFVLDKGNSYRKTCEVLNGQYISFEMGRPIRVNPFARQPDSEGVAFLVEMLAMMASGGDERERLRREEKTLIQMAIKMAYESIKDREVVLTDILMMLRKEAIAQAHGASVGMGERIALKLVPFSCKGQFGQFFDGPNELDVKGKFVVFELANLSRYPDLQLVVLLNIMFFVTERVSDPLFMGERKFLLIDEAWQLLKMADTADFIGNAFKTFRKYRCSAVAITQEVGDLLSQPAGLAILANTAHKIFLKQEAGTIDRYRQEMALSEEVIAALKSLRTVKGSYSDLLAVTPSGSGVLRLMPDPLLYWVSTSDPIDNQYLAQVRSNHDGDLIKALTTCAREHPYGIH